MTGERAETARQDSRDRGCAAMLCSDMLKEGALL